MDCEMCGREEAVVKASVEGTVLALCGSCGRYGKVVSKIVVEQPQQHHAEFAKTGKKPAPEEAEFVVGNFGTLLKQKREELGKSKEDKFMKLEDFAKLISVRESILHKMETGAFKPGVEEAARIGKILGLRLVERIVDIESEIPPAKKDELTLGDLIKIKKR
jgi:uncharacterized protein (TIGR00270 family)